MSTTTHIIASTEWVEIGLAPAEVENNSVFAIYLAVADTIPAASETGHVAEKGETVTLTGAGTIYGRLIFPAQGPVSVAMTPVVVGGGGGGGSGTSDTLESTQVQVKAAVQALNTKAPALVSGRIPVDGSGVVQPVSATALPLPAGAATAVLQTAGNTSLASLDTKAPALVSGRIPVDGSGVTQPVSGPLTDAQLRATAVSVAPNVTRGAGAADANTQRVTLASDGPAVTGITSIDTKTPALTSGRVPMAAPPIDGALAAVPAASANGSALTGRPTGSTAVRIYIPASGSITYTIATAQPGSPPTATLTATGDTTGAWLTEPLGAGVNIYVTALTGAATFRWL